MFGHSHSNIIISIIAFIDAMSMADLQNFPNFDKTAI